MEELTIDSEFRDLCPPLLPEEYKLLKAGLIADGCLDPIITWANHGTILDGHNRYEICREHEIPYKAKALAFKTRDEAREWIARHQLGRRNLNESQRAMIAAHLITTKNGGEKQSANLQTAPITAEKAAEICNVSTRTVASAKKVLDEGSAPLQKAVAAGEVPASVAATVAELPKAEQKKIVAKGPEAMKKAAKEVKAAKVKKYNDPFDTAALDKQRGPKNGKALFDDKKIDELFGKIAKALDERKEKVGGLGSLYHACHNTLDAALKAWRALRA